MATSAAIVERKFQLPGIEIIRRMHEACRLETVSLQEGGLGGTFGSRRHAGATFCSVAVNFALHARCMPPRGHYLSCYVHQAPPGSWCAGMPLAADTVLIALPDSACEMMLGAQAHLSMVLAPLHDGIQRAIEGYCGSFGLAGRQFALLARETHAGTPWRVLYETLSHSMVGENDHGLGRLLESIAADFLVDDYGLRALLVGTAAVLPCACTHDAHYPALRKAAQFMRENLARDIYMEEVAAAAQVSDRTLRLAFDDLLGVSPTRYLNLLRLHEASRRLSGGQVQRLSVKAVAMNCGIWNLSRFAASYYRAFGEHPSDTRLRAASFVS